MFWTACGPLKRSQTLRPLDPLSQVLLDQLHQRGEWPLTRPILLSLSGGRDSTALCHALLDAGIRPVLYHCCYQLRGEDSREDARFVQDLGSRYGLETVVDTLPTDWARELAAKGQNLQQEARRYRYHRLEELRRETWKNALITTAHHADDQAETFLLALLKGRGGSRLAGLVDGPHRWRPWLKVTGERIAAYVRDKGWDYRLDHSNTSDAYDRNFIRLHLAPLLQRRFPGWVEALGREAADWARMEQGLQDWISNRTDEGGPLHRTGTPYGTFFWLGEQEKDEPMRGVLEDRYWLSLGANRSQMEALRAAWDLKPGKKLACGSGQVYRFRNALCFLENEPQPWGPVSVLSSETELGLLNNRVLTCGWHRMTWDFAMDKAVDLQDWTWQSIQTTHRVDPKKPGWSSSKRKPIKEILAGYGVGEVLRRDWPVLCYQNQAVWTPLVHGSGLEQSPVQEVNFAWPFDRLQWTWLGPEDLLSFHDPRPGNG